MSKPPKHWPLWKIAVTSVSCVVAAGVLVGLSFYPHLLGVGETPDQGTDQLFALPGFFLMLGMAFLMLAVVCLVWLGLRIKEARTPPWERKPKRKRRSRRR